MDLFYVLQFLFPAVNLKIQLLTAKDTKIAIATALASFRQSTDKVEVINLIEGVDPHLYNASAVDVTCYFDVIIYGGLHLEVK